MPRRTVRRRQFRAVVLWTIIGVALMQIALGTIIDVALPAVRDPEFMNREEMLRELLGEETGKPIVVMLGSSRTQLGVDAQGAMNALDRRALVFNFGIPASGPFLEGIWLERLRTSGIKPDVLFIEVLPPHYNTMDVPADQRGLDGARLSAKELTQVPLTSYSLRGAWRRWLVARVLPSYRHRAEIYGWIGIDENPHGARMHQELLASDRYGWRFSTPAPEIFPALKKMAHAQYDSCYRDFHLSRPQVALLKKNIADCRREAIQPVVLLPPEGTEFRNLYSPEMSSAIDDMLIELREQLHVRVVDARDWVNDVHFYDMHHLLPEGARVFSNRLAREAIAPLLKNPVAVASRHLR